MLWWTDSCQKRVSGDQCHMTVSRTQMCNSMRWRVLFKLISPDQLLVLINRRLRSKLSHCQRSFDHMARFVSDQWIRTLMTSCMRMLKITSAVFYCIHFKNSTKQAILSSLLLPSYLKVAGFKIRFLEILTFAFLRKYSVNSLVG